MARQDDRGDGLGSVDSAPSVVRFGSVDSTFGLLRTGEMNATGATVGRDPNRTVYRAQHNSGRVFYVEAEDKIPSAEFTYREIRARDMPPTAEITEGAVVHGRKPWPKPKA